jgi:hypothetical protein
MPESMLCEAGITGRTQNRRSHVLPRLVVFGALGSAWQERPTGLDEPFVPPFQNVTRVEVDSWSSGQEPTRRIQIEAR